MSIFQEIDTFGGEYIEIPNQVRLYYKPQTNSSGLKCGFEFIAVQCIAYDPDEGVFSSMSDVEIVIEGIAHFDGVRHLYFGSEKTDNYGYHYYPDLEMEIALLKSIRELELKYCQYTETTGP